VRNGSADSNSSSVDSGVGGSFSQESMDYEHGSTVSSTCAIPGLEKVDECEMDSWMNEGDPLQPKGEDSPDYPESVVSQAIRGSFSLLVEVFSNQVSADKLASDLYSKFLIENTICGEVRMQGITEEAKARRVLDAVMSKLRTCPTEEPFERFILVLESYPSCCDIVVQIRATYQELQKSSEASGRCNSNAHHHAREELVCGSSTRTAAQLQQQGDLQQSLVTVQENQPDLSLSGAVESLDGRHHQQKSSIFTMLRQRSISSGGESDVSMTEEEIQDRLKKLERESRTLAREMQKCLDRKQKDAGTMEEIAHRLELTVEDLQTQVEEYTKKLEICTKEKQVLEGQLTIARRRILQLNREVITLKKHPMACAGTCEHKSKCEKLKKQIEKLKEEKLDYTAKIENLTQQIDILLSGDYVFND
jgi:archaellum component FlaC